MILAVSDLAGFAQGDLRLLSPAADGARVPGSLLDKVEAAHRPVAVAGPGQTGGIPGAGAGPARSVWPPAKA